MTHDTPFGFATDAIHAGEDETSSATPIYQAATVGGSYMRGSNPTLEAFEKKICALDGGRRGIATACGMAAVTQTLLTLLKAGSRVVCHQMVYHWTRELMTVDLPNLGIEAEQIDFRDGDQLARALSKPTDVVYFEPLANPGLDVIDTQAVINLARSAQATVVVDNTFLSPYLFRPLELGAHVVLHSATKYLCGHGDALAGVIVTQDEVLGDRIARTRNVYGGVMNPMIAFLLMRGVKTLPLRMDRHCANAQRVAEFLDAHPRVGRVYYPGLSASPGHEIAREQWSGFGGMVSFEIADEGVHRAFFERVRVCRPWVSLGDVGSLVTSWGGLGRVRMSVGLEDVADIIGDLDQALNGP